MKLTFPVSLTAADAESRIIAGRIVQWDAEGNTSAGRTKFLPNSIEFGKNTKLVLEHNRTKPLGKLVEWSQDDTGITASFKIAKTTAGNDALEEAATGLRSDFSVGVEVDAWDNKNGVMAISASKLIEVSLVTDGAIPGAEVEKVAAAEEPGTAATDSNPEPQIEAPKTEGDDLVSETVSEAVSTETVEAAKVEVKATTAPVLNSQRVRTPIVDAASFLEHSVRASLGDETSKLYITAASDGTSTDWAGLVPTPQLSEVINGKGTIARPTIQSVSTAALPPAGLTFEIPRVKTMPTVTKSVAEKGAFGDTQGEIEYLSVSVKKAAGMQKFDVEVLDRTSPAFFNELVSLMAEAYAAATDEAMYDALINNGTLDATTITQPWDGDELAGFISRAAASIYKSTKRYPTGIVMSPDQWGKFVGLTDSNKRNLFNVAGSPSNPTGALTPTDAVGNIYGLPVYVTPNSGLTDGDSSVIVVNRDSYTFYESAAPLQLRTNIVATGQVEVGYYGYYAIAPKLGAGAFRFNNA